MNNDLIIASTFLIYMIILIIIGFYAYLKTKALSDYVLGGRSLGPWVAALSAGASDMSGWLLLGLPGLAYSSGLGAVWLAISLLLGTGLNWSFVAARLRMFSIQTNDSLTVPSYLYARFADHKHLLKISSSIIIIFFYTIYTSSGLIAGAKLLTEVFGLSYESAIVFSSLSIISYTLFGGFLAVSWTDLFQGLLMSAALMFVPIFCLSSYSVSSIESQLLSQKGLTFFSMMTDAEGKPFSVIAILSFLGWGLGYFGQPHILARFKAIKSQRAIPRASFIAISWTGICLFGALGVGLSGLLTLPVALDDPEKVFMALVNTSFHPVIAGILLAAILAAVMSTADSQLLVASSVLTEDFYKNFINKNASSERLVVAGRYCVILITILSSIIALNPNHHVLDVVAYAWAGFGASFGPTLVLSLCWRRFSGHGAVAGILSGGSVVFIWKNLSGGIFELYEIIPGILASTLLGLLVSYIKPAKAEDHELFDRTIKALEQEG